MPQPVYVFLRRALRSRQPSPNASHSCPNRPSAAHHHTAHRSHHRAAHLSTDLSAFHQTIETSAPILSTLRHAAGKRPGPRRPPRSAEALKALTTPPSSATPRRRPRKIPARILRTEQQIQKQTPQGTQPARNCSSIPHSISTSTQPLCSISHEHGSPKLSPTSTRRRTTNSTPSAKPEKPPATSPSPEPPPPNPSPLLATHFEAAQKTLGAWHDCLLLLDEAKSTLPEQSPTTDSTSGESISAPPSGQ